jgi:uncharacterized protein YmfQ (DUF2313 family)
MREYTEEDYAQQLRNLLPRGLAWRLQDGSILMALLRGLAKVMHKVASRAWRIVTKEQFPGAVEEMYPDWETELGLPDPCRPGRQNVEQRAYDILYKYNLTGGQTKAYFIGIAKFLGFDVEIEEFKAFRVGENTCGQAIQDDNWYFVWRVLWLNARISVFRVGIDTCGTALRSWILNHELECLLGRYKPAHTHVIVAYKDLENPEPYETFLRR